VILVDDLQYLDRFLTSNVGIIIETSYHQVTMSNMRFDFYRLKSYLWTQVVIAKLCVYIYFQLLIKNRTLIIHFKRGSITNLVNHEILMSPQFFRQYF